MDNLLEGVSYAMSCSVLVATYSGAISMAFTANLAVTLWVAVYRKYKDQWTEFGDIASKIATALDSREQLGMKWLWSSIVIFRVSVKGLWWMGSISGLIAVLFLYLLRWFYPYWGDFPFCDLVSLRFAAFTSPAVMIMMVFVAKAMKYRIERKIEKLVALTTQATQAGTMAFDDATELFQKP